MRPRIRLSSILCLIAFCGVGFAALRSPSQLWASTLFSAALASLPMAVISAVYRREKQRAFWLGFALCGTTYFAACFAPWFHEMVGPRLVTTALLDMLYPRVDESAPRPFAKWVDEILVVGGEAEYTDVYQQFAKQSRVASRPNDRAAVFIKRVVNRPPNPWAEWTEPDRTSGVATQIGRVSLVSPEPFRRIGHSLITLLVGVAGGLYARHRFASQGGPS